jgi:C-terminal processing protease CtpA/Prc
MPRSLPALPWLLLLLLASPSAVAQPPAGRPELAGLLDFEAEHVGGVPKNWNGGPPNTFAVDDKIVHGGKWALRIERNDTSPSTLTAVSKTIPIDFVGAQLELRGFLRTADVSGFAGLWMRQDDDGGMLALENMQARKLEGTTEWTEHAITLPLNKAAKRLVFGVLASGTGRVWADDLRLLVDGKPIADVPRVEAPKTIVDLDKEFDGGSGIAPKELSKIQIANLAMLGKVWGFVKYHHPLVTSGKRHWDYDLFRVLPRVLAATDAPTARAAVNEWIAGLGTVPPCAPCAVLVETELHLQPPITWLTDDVLGSELAATLRAIHRNRPAEPRQFYVSLAPGIGNPSFEHEPNYATLKLPDTGYQLLALYRFWNIVEYWFPYRDVIGGSWDEELAAFIPRIAMASDAETYKREMMALIARVHDTHANLWSSLDVRPPTGACQIPITVRFIEDQPVVTAVPDATTAAGSGLQRGDVLSAIDGVPVAELVKRWSPYYAASNAPTRVRDIARGMTRGACGPVALSISRDGKTVEMKAERTAPSPASSSVGRTHDRPGDTFQKLSPEVAYLKLSSVKIAEVPSYIESAAGTKGLIIDIRNYPSEFMVFALGTRLVDRPTPFARFTMGDPANPGAFHWRGQPLTLGPAAPRYTGKIVILIDEVSQSQAEYTTMAFRAAPNATVIGSTTAGADGNVSAIPLPGGLRSMISGIGVFYPDKKPTQRIGIIPDIEVKPTLRGIRAGRDEVMEAALRHILGPDVPAAVIEKMAKQ